MIVMINGPFGIGKTTVSQMLKESVENAMIFDPEEVGFMLRNIVTEDIKLPSEKTGDFQDLKPWKVLTVDVAENLIKTYQKNLIIPMTIWNTEYFSYIRNGLKKIDNDIHHFCLLAKKETIFQRLTKRGDAPGSWTFQQTEKCLNSFENNPQLFSQLVYTDEMNVCDVHQYIMKLIRGA